MSKHNPKVTLQQMRDAARRAQSLCEGIKLEDLRVDWIRLLAFERCFEIIGEAIKRLPPDLREKYPQVDWKKAAGARDVVAHGYDWIDHQVLWDAAKIHFPILFTTIAQMLADLGGELPAETDEA